MYKLGLRSLLSISAQDKSPSAYPSPAMCLSRLIYFKNVVRETITLGPAYNEVGYKELPAVTSGFLCIKMVDCNDEKDRLQRAATFDE